jgi:predicted  nucleic acid-binding Zn-ribbon protein
MEIRSITDSTIDDWELRTLKHVADTKSAIYNLAADLRHHVQGLKQLQIDGALHHDNDALHRDLRTIHQDNDALQRDLNTLRVANQQLHVEIKARESLIATLHADLDAIRAVLSGDSADGKIS